MSRPIFFVLVSPGTSKRSGVKIERVEKEVKEQEKKKDKKKKKKKRMDE